MKKLIALFITLVCVYLTMNAQSRTGKATIDVSDLKTIVNKNIFGQFSEHLGRCIYGGYWVGENSKIPNTNGIRNDVVQALKRIKVPVLRWPGGCFADEYHWKDGIGPREKRPSMINTNWGGVTEDNSFGTHEFMELCRQLECEPYICGNVGSGTVQELAQWVEYVNSDNVSPMTDLRKKNGREKSWGVKYWGIGNENWGCGGNMRPEFYADQVRKYGTYCRDYGNNKIFKIACGPAGDDYNWSEVLMRDASGFIGGLSLHHYAFNDGKIATDFDESGWFTVLKSSLMIENYINKHSTVMDKYDPNKKVALMVDEWGTWYGVEPGTNPGFLFQQNTMRDAVTAACNLNIFINHCDRIRMANIAQTVNVLQAMILTDNEKMLLTPTYHVFDLFKVHQNALYVRTTIESPDYIFGTEKLPAVNGSSSIGPDGTLHISLCNIDPKSGHRISCELKKYTATKVSGQILTANTMNAHNTFDHPDVVVPGKFSDFSLQGKNLDVTLPPMSVVVLAVEGSYELAPSLDIKNPTPGLKYQYYEGRWDKLPNFDLLSPMRSGTIGQFGIPDENSNENFAVRLSGYIHIPADGIYTFFVNSDDGADIVIDGGLIADNDGRHAPQERSGTIVLKKGFHEIRVGFFQAGGGKVVDVSIEGPGLQKQLVPAKMLFH
jgi:alpha-L-arabinofuranosidase